MKVIFFVLFCLPLITSAQIITTIGGNGINGDSGDGGLAVQASLNRPYGGVFDKKGNFYYAEPNNHKIRKITPSGYIYTVAGTGVASFSGDDGLAINATLHNPMWVDVDKQGNIYIADAVNHRIRKVDTLGIIRTIAGNGDASFSGDSGPAINASLVFPSGIHIDKYGNIYEAEDSRIRKIDTNGIIHTIIGNGIAGFSGDGGQAILAQINAARCYVDSIGNVTITDNIRIRRIDALTGIITTVAGSDTGQVNADNIPAVSASLDPVALAWDENGNMIIADLGHNRVRMIDGNGIIHTIAGNGVAGFSGDGGPADSAEIYDPSGVAFDSCGNLFISSKENFRIRKVTYHVCDTSNHTSFVYTLNKPTFSIYPNPAATELTVTTGNSAYSSLIITNSIGQQVLLQAVTNATTKVNIAALAAGVYYVEVKGDMGSKVMKFVKI